MFKFPPQFAFQSQAYPNVTSIPLQSSTSMERCPEFNEIHEMLEENVIADVFGEALRNVNLESNDNVLSAQSSFPDYYIKSDEASTSMERCPEFNEIHEMLEENAFADVFGEALRNVNLESNDNVLSAQSSFPDYFIKSVEASTSNETYQRKSQARKTRIPFEPEQKKILEAKFISSETPTREEIEALSQKLMVSERKVKVWFVNRRQKARKAEREALLGRNGSTSKKRSARTKITLECKRELEAALADNMYPSKKTKEELVKSTHLPLHKIEKWFMNKRRSSKV